MCITTRAVSSCRLGDLIKNVFEEPLIAANIVKILLEKNEWVTVLNMKHVFKNRFCDMVQNRSLTKFKLINETNRQSYVTNRLIDTIKIKSSIIENIGPTKKSLVKLKKKIKLHDEFLNYLIQFKTLLQNLSTFHMFNIELQRKLEFYFQNVPIYERQAQKYLNILYPNSIYSKYNYYITSIEDSEHYILNLYDINDYTSLYNTDFYLDNEY